MFDELDQKNSARPSAEDIFSETDKTAKPEPFAPRGDNFSPAAKTVIPANVGFLKNKFLVFGLIFGGLIVIIAGGYFGLRVMVKNSSTINNIETNAQADKDILPESEAPEITNNSTNQAVQPAAVQPVDSDFDGLTDEEESALGLEINNADTDGDGLTDREEAKVYLTDPLKADTDGDGYSDGDEIKNNYNPNGAGKLHEIK